MSRFSVVYSDRARRHLAAIERYIAQHATPLIAARYAERILQRCERLALAPLQGESLEHLRPGTRKSGMEGRVTIIFLVGPTSITILSISYAGRSYLRDVAEPS